MNKFYKLYTNRKKQMRSSKNKSLTNISKYKNSI